MQRSTVAINIVLTKSTDDQVTDIECGIFRGNAGQRDRCEKCGTVPPGAGQLAALKSAMLDLNVIRPNVHYISPTLTKIRLTTLNIFMNVHKYLVSLQYFTTAMFTGALQVILSIALRYLSIRPGSVVVVPQFLGLALSVG